MSRMINGLEYGEMFDAMKGHYEIRPDVMLKLSAHFPDWHFPKEE